MAGSARAKTVVVHEFVTGGGLAEDESPPASWLDEGNAMRRALAQDFAALPGIDVVMTLDRRLPEEHGPWKVARVTPGDELARLAGLAATSDAVVCVAPEPSDILRSRVALIEQAGGFSLGSTAEAIALASSKPRLTDFWRERDVPVPSWSRTLRAGEALPADAPFPIVRKPAIGAGCLETMLIESPDQSNISATCAYDAFLQPFVPGIPLSASFLVDRWGRAELIGVGRQNIVVKDGEFRYEGGTLPFGEGIPTDVLLRALDGIDGLRGWIGLDFVWNPASQGVIMLELNARLTTSFVGWRAWFATPGVLAARWLRAVAGWDIAAPEPRQHGDRVTFSPDGDTKH